MSNGDKKRCAQESETRLSSMPDEAHQGLFLCFFILCLGISIYIAHVGLRKR
jgi:hypothetical protein